MSKISKLIAHLRSKPSEVSLGDIIKLLEVSGFKLSRTSGSHNIFKHENGQTITVPTKSGRKVKGIYLQKVLELVEIYEYDSN